MKPLRLLFMGTPEFALPALEALHASAHDVVGVYTQPPRPAGRGQKEKLSPVHAFALAQGIPVYTPVTLRDTETQSMFIHHQADACIVSAYGLLLPKAILEGTKYGCINIHPSLLPRWRGAAPIQRTLMAGDTETGVVIMQMNEGLDTGDMLKVTRLAVPAEANAGELQDVLASVSATLLLEVLSSLDTLIPVPQAEYGVTYAAKISKAECLLDWNASASELYHKIRGLAPSPGAYFNYQGEMIKVFAARVITGNAARAGTVLDNQLTIACAQDALQLLQLQRPGKRPLPAAEILKGFSIARGSII